MYIYVCSVCLHASMYAYIYLLRFKNTFLLFQNEILNWVLLALWRSHLENVARTVVGLRMTRQCLGSWCLPIRSCAYTLEITSQDAANGEESGLKHGSNTVPTIDIPETCAEMYSMPYASTCMFILST